MKNDIKFGTDGWRGITGFDFIDEKVRLISAGVAKYIKNKATQDKRGKKDPAPSVVVGYDTRFLSDRFAHSAASILNHNKIRTSISNRYVTSPMLSAEVVRSNADLGVMITASHNPYYYNGYKIKGSFGGSATMDIVTCIESEVNKLRHEKDLKGYINAGNLPGSGFEIEKKDFYAGYKDYILSLVDTELIKKNFNFPVVIDSMYGAGQDIFEEIIKELSSSKVYHVHKSLNTSFGAINPEPIGENLNDAISVLKKEKCSIALCIDGDGDRIGAIGQNGNFVSSHHIFAVVLDYLIKFKKISGRVVKTVSTSSIIDRICQKHKIELVTKPVGFKHIGEEILAGQVIMGGEESGGLWTSGYIPERDGILMSLILIEIICKNGLPINEILKDIYNSYGFFLYRRCDYEIENTKKEKLRKLLERKIPDELKAGGASEPVTIDGFKYFFQDGSWIMIRPSGTEAVVRIYAESDSTKKLDYLHQIGKKILENTGQAG